MQRVLCRWQARRTREGEGCAELLEAFCAETQQRWLPCSHISSDGFTSLLDPNGPGKRWEMKRNETAGDGRVDVQYAMCGCSELCAGDGDGDGRRGRDGGDGGDGGDGIGPRKREGGR